MPELWLLSVVCLGLVVLLCALGMVTRYRHELSPLQWIGLLGIWLGSMPRLFLLLDTGGFDGSRMPAMASVFAYVGLACYAVGTAWRVVWYRRRRGDNLDPPKARNMTTN